MAVDVRDKYLIHDSLRIVRDLIASGTTDPISASRSTNSSFVTIRGSKRPKEFPVVIVDKIGMPGVPLGIQSEAMEFTFMGEADCQSTSAGYDAKGVDWVASDVINALRTNQRGVSPQSGTQAHGLFDLKFLGIVPYYPERGPNGLKGIKVRFLYKYQSDVS